MLLELLMSTILRLTHSDISLCSLAASVVTPCPGAVEVPACFTKPANVPRNARSAQRERPHQALLTTPSRIRPITRLLKNIAFRGCELAWLADE